MPAPYTGRCACGAVTATIAAEPFGVKLCYCRQCQKLAAGGPTANAVFLLEHVHLTGQLAGHSAPAASGNTATQYFCPQCGTPVCGGSSAVPHMRAIRLGFLDTGHGLKPDGAIWVGEAPEWCMIDPAIAQDDRQMSATAPEA